jgi:hypothetical protein
MAVARARLVAYSRWQLMDYAWGAGGITLIVVCLWAWAAASVRVVVETGASRPASFETLVHLLAFFGTVFATTNLVSEDRARGYYRFQFAKPVDPILFYAQAFAIRGIAVVAMAALISGLGAITAHPVPVVTAVGYTGIMYMLAGGVTLLQSTVWRYAWVGTLALYAASSVAARLAAPGALSSRVWHALWLGAHWVLPPFAAQNGLWSLGYGVLALIVAAVVIRRLEWGR